MNVLSLFDGISCGRVALERAGANVENYYASEIDTKAIHIAKKNYPETIHLGDIEYWESWIDRLPKIDLVMGGSPCFVAGTLVNTINGQVPIELIQLGDMCLSPDGNYYRVTEIGGEEKEIWKLRGTGIIETGTTENHPYLTRKRIDEDSRWKKVCELEAGDYLGIPIIQKEENTDNLTVEDCRMIGKIISQQEFDIGYESKIDLKKYCGSQFEPHFNIATLNLPKDLLLEVFRGYVGGEMWLKLVSDPYMIIQFCSTSDLFLNNFILMVAKLWHITMEFSIQGPLDKNTHRLNLKIASMNKLKTFVDLNNPEILWTPFERAFNTHTTQRVYNITVEESHTYTANNAIVHNCQGFSSNGKGLNFSDPRSKLFFTMVDIYKYIQKNNNPNVHFLLENVFMKKEWENVITNILGFEPVKINSELVGGALRSRNYWVDWDISIPENKGIVLQDLLESGLAYKRKADCIQASYDTGSISHSIEKSVNTLVAEPAQPDNTIESHNGSHRAFEVKDGQMVTWQMKKENHAGVRLSEKAIHQINLPDGWYTFRGFTPRELERLQTLPDFYCDGLDYAAIAHAVGNGWTVDVIKSIFDDLFMQHPEYLK